MKFGAIYGVSEGLQGNAYAIPTKDLRVAKNKGYKSISPSEITFSIKKMLRVIKSMPDKKFMVAYRNKADEMSLCGYTGVELLVCFINAMNEERFYPDNLYFSEEWHEILNYNNYIKLELL